MWQLENIEAMVELMLQEYNEEEIIEMILDILRMAYIRGMVAAADELHFTETDYYITNWEEWEKNVILKKFDNKTVVDRLRDYIHVYDIYRIATVIDTEYHRDFNTGKYDMAEHVDKQSVTRVKKVYRTMMDERVRDTHDYLEGKEVGIDEKFYTYDGDSARFPGDFTLAENNINCRCYVEYKR